jgi:phosphohistidine phosphatase
MKTLLILRHGKAQEDAPRGDKARLLTERGERESALMGRLIGEMEVRPDAVVSSDAARARQTADLAARAAGFAGGIEFEPDIYGAGLDDLLGVVRGLSDKWNCVLFVGHNPGFEDLCAALAKEGTEPPQLPTAGLACLVFDKARRWKDVREGSGNLVGVYRPRDYRDRPEPQ